MIDCFNIKQGMIFFINDLSAEDSIIFKGEDTPRKRRPWVIVSSDVCNTCSRSVTAVPIFTGTDIRFPTQVYFEHNKRPQVIRCEKITNIPKDLIDIKCYAGMLSPHIFKKVQTAIMKHVSSPSEDEALMQTINNNIDIILQSMNMKQLIVDKLFEMLTNKTINTEDTTTKTNNLETTATSLAATNPIYDLDDEILNSITKGYDDVDIDEEDVVAPTTDEPTEEVTPTVKKTVTKKASTAKKKTRTWTKPRKLQGKTMTIDDAMDFYLDCSQLSQHDLYKKWKDYGVIDDASYQSKKKYVAKQRLIKEGLIKG